MTGGPAVAVLPRQEDALQVLDRLTRLRCVNVEARWLDADGATSVSRGTGHVTVHDEPGQSVTVLEEGRWTFHSGQPLRFRGGYRWQARDQELSVAHLRRGEEDPVPLLHLVPLGDGVWVSKEAHLCGEDSYHARLRVAPDHVALRWVVRGPQKAYTLLLKYGTTA